MKSKFIDIMKKPFKPFFSVINDIKNNIVVRTDFYSEIIISFNASHQKLAENYNITRKIESEYAAFNT